jgi:tRNA(Arg) A34 adenosine deaminase TadA
MLQGKGGPFGAVIVRADQVISIACNEVLCTNDPTAHAEILAIRRAGEKLETYDLSGCVIYATAEPCPMCLAAIIWANIDKVYYASSVEEAEKIGFRDSRIYRHMRGEERIIELEQIDSEACVELYEAYRELGRTIY